jgi:hypothetical protein
VYHLEVGQPDFATPAQLVAAAQAALGEGYTTYIPNAGLPVLRAAVAARSCEGGGGGGGGAAGQLTAENVVVTPGAVFACATALMACVQPGEEVLLPDPGWCNYEMALEMMGGVGVHYPLRAAHGWLPDPAEVAARITPRTKLLLLNSPGNPTGAYCDVPRLQVQPFATDDECCLVLLLTNPITSLLVAARTATCGGRRRCWTWRARTGSLCSATRSMRISCSAAGRRGRRGHGRVDRRRRRCGARRPCSTARTTTRRR